MQFFPRVCIQRTQELLVSVISFRFSPFQFYASCLLQVVYEFSLNEKLKREHLESPNSAEVSMSPSFFRPLLSDANQVKCEGSADSNFMTPIFMSHFFAWEIDWRLRCNAFNHRQLLNALQNQKYRGLSGIKTHLVLKFPSA